MLSAFAVIIMGLEAVPLASILPPLAIINVDASAPDPGSAFITVPAGIVKVAPSPTTTLPLINHILSLDKVLSDVKTPSRVESAKGSTSTVSVTVTSTSFTTSTVSIIVSGSFEQEKRTKRIKKNNPLSFTNFNFIIYYFLV